MNTSRIKRGVSHHRNSYLNGLEHWQESLTLMTLLTLLCVLGLNNSGVDEWLLELLKWVGTDCSWCTIHPS
ncbi:hypothetical protein [Herbaspirillum sp. meg3]|uniref:hypothetical protein n=1 Tax=Herbaspirillum sp. meg3 TaxID=2025949 RepID=UPI0012FE43A9|nr:hypothetical protein [Herbaspirillum sp. meg3]